MFKWFVGLFQSFIWGQSPSCQRNALNIYYKNSCSKTKVELIKILVQILNFCNPHSALILVTNTAAISQEKNLSRGGRDPVIIVEGKPDI